MKNIIRFLLLLLFLNSFSVSAQIDEYLKKEEHRISKAEKIEQDIENFILDNLFSYSLSQSKIDEIRNNLIDEHDGFDHQVTSIELEKILIEVKKNNLRELYLLQHPNVNSFFYPTTLSDELKQQCVNGGFESGIANYTFTTLTVNPSVHIGDGCNANVPSGAFVPTGLNLFQNSASLVSPGNEPLLFALGIPINRVKSGNRALKLNPNPTTASGDGQIGNRTTVSRNFIINENAIDFSYLHIGSVVTTNTHWQPSFSYKLIDNNTNNVLRSVCIRMNINNCRYRQVPDTRPTFAGNIISYTPQWVCERINTADLIGRNVRLEFMISDCDFRGHFSTVYIDDVCGVTCPPTWGSINLNPVNINCPSEPFTICGTITSGPNNTLQNISVSVHNQSGAALGFGGITNYIVTGNTFCCTVNPSAFGPNPSGNYYFQAVANITSICGTNSIFDVLVGTVSFNNCCQPTLTLNFPVDNISNVPTANPAKLRRTSNWIKASNHIIVGSNLLGDGVVYHAGNYIELLPGAGLSQGFEALFGSQFSAYIATCPTGFVYKNGNEGSNKEEPIVFDDENQMDLIKTKINIYPNPTNSYFTISYANEKFNNIKITSLEGRLVFTQKMQATNNYQLDISNFKNGIYTVSIETLDGTVITDKLIKN